MIGVRDTLPTGTFETAPGRSHELWVGAAEGPLAPRHGNGRLSRHGVFEDPRGAFLADHDRGRVSVAGRNLRHDRGVGDAQPFDP
jgi:hypothetical protein